MRRRIVVTVAAGLFVVIVAASFLLVALTRPDNGKQHVDQLGLGGTDVTERDLSPAEQVQLLNMYAPVPVPTGATDIRLKYQRFQDIFFEGSFAVPPAQYDDYVRQLKPLGPTVGVAPGSAYAGVIVGNYTSIVVPDPAAYRITISYVAG